MSWKTELMQSTNTYLHLYNRGVDRMAIFRSEYDYAFWLDLMEETLPEYQVDLLLYSLMPNHYHFACLQRKAYEISWFIHDVCWRYAKFFNKKYGRVGPLFAGRFVPKLVTDDAGLLRLSHYIHRNPVSAGLVKLPGEWSKSSFKCYVDGRSDGLVNTKIILDLVGGATQYQAFMNEFDPTDLDAVNRFLSRTRRGGSGAR
jgi:putative transposase